jgi:hypothetical protein
VGATHRTQLKDKDMTDPKEIDKFLRKYKINEKKTKIDLPLLIELLDLWGNETFNSKLLSECLDVLKFTRKRMQSKGMGCAEIDLLIIKLNPFEKEKQYKTLEGNVERIPNSTL